MTVENKKKLGAYYTPKIVTDALSEWAIRDSTDKILEPSFGGCNFLTSSIRILKKKNSIDPSTQIFGFDVDSNAFENLKKNSIDVKNFYCEDFLLSNHTISVNIILGNPPFLAAHKIENEYKKLIYQFFPNNLGIPRRSSLWVYFIYKSLSHLSSRGRMAWVVPDSLSFTHYGKKFLNFLCSQFSKVDVVRIEERYFTESGTLEKTSFLLCDDFGGNCALYSEKHFLYVKEALDFVLSNRIDKKISINTTPKKVIKENFKSVTLGELFSIKIGIVLGATKYLVLNEKEAKNSPYYPNYLYPIISKGKQLDKGIQISKVKLINNYSNSPIYLIDGLKLEKENLNLYSNLVNSIPEKILINQTFKKRNKLFGYDDYSFPDVFLTFFSQGIPKFIVNRNNELNCTNSVHRLFLKRPLDLTILHFVAIQFYTNCFLNDINDHARKYGNSIFKFEPSDAANIRIVIPKNLTEDLTEKIQNWVFQIEQDHNGSSDLKEQIKKDLSTLIFF